MASTLLYLVRHGAHQHPAAGGDPDPGLSPLGEQQGRLLGPRLADVPFDVLLHSPLRRATQTAQILSGYLPGVPVRPSDLLRDRTAVPAGDQDDTLPEQYRAFLDRVPPDERDPGAQHLNAAVDQLMTTGSTDRCELLVTHNFVTGWFVRHALDAPWWRFIGLHQVNCALTIIEASAGSPPVLVSFNDVGHLPVPLRGHLPVPLRS